MAASLPGGAAWLACAWLVTGVCSAAAAPFACPAQRDAREVAAVHTQAPLAQACTDPSGTWDGPYRELFPNGTVAAKGRFARGKEDGAWVLRYGNGREAESGLYRDGKREGAWTSFYDTGVPLSQGEYRQGLQQGPWRTWHENGTLKSQGDYEAGEETGRWTTWYPNGQKKSEGEYRGRHTDPRRNVSLPAESGRWTYWAEDGHVTLEGCFEHGAQVGAWTEAPGSGPAIVRTMPRAAAAECR